MAENKFIKSIVERNPFARRKSSANDVVDPSNIRQYKDLLNKFGYKVVNVHNQDVLIPKNFDKEDELIPFLQYWTSAGINGSEYENKRKTFYEMYKKMDEEQSEITMTLDTYADEMFSVGFIDNPIEIEFKGVDEEVAKKVKKILIDNNVISTHRADGRNLCKFGDIAYRIHYPENGDPDNITLTTLTPDKWKINITDKIVKLVKNYEMEDSTYEMGVNANKTLEIFELIQFSVPDNEYAPYGRSLLDGLRNAADHLMTIEALLALSRASKVERIILKIPTESSNPTAAFAQLNMVKSQWKNLIFKDSSGNVKSTNKTLSLQEILYLPAQEGFEIDKLQSSIDLSSIEDVEYFRDKLLQATRLPKGYFASDESRYMGGGALSAMDLKFARALIPYQRAYAQGLTKLCTVLTYFTCKYKGIDLDVDKLDITVKIKKSPQIASELLDVYAKVIDVADRMFSTYKDHNKEVSNDGVEKEAKINPEAYREILIKLGMPEDLADVFIYNSVKGANKESAKKDLKLLAESCLKVESKDVISAKFMKEAYEGINKKR